MLEMTVAIAGTSVMISLSMDETGTRSFGLMDPKALGEIRIPPG